MISSVQSYAQTVDSNRAKDSIQHSMYEHVHAPILSNPHDSITKYQFHHHNYQGLGELVGSLRGSVLQQLGDPLTYSTISVFNSFAHHLNVSLNGISLNDHLSNAGNLYSIHPEAVHKAQMYIGSDAAIIGGSAGPYIYLQENMYSTSKPFSKLWYIQGGYDLIGTEGLLTQNIDTNLNIHGSFRRLSSGGMLQNAGSESWNTRLGIRYAPTNKIHYSMQWLFGNHGSYHNGGVIGEYQNPINANVMYDNYFQRRYSHHVQFNMTAHTLVNTNDVLLFNAFYQNELLETRGINPYIIRDSTRLEFSPSTRFGMHIRHEIPNVFPGFSFMNEIGFNYGNYTLFNRFKDSDYMLHAYSYAKYDLTPDNVLRFGIRMVHSTGGNYINPGISFTTQLAPSVSMKFDISQTSIVPSIMQRSLFMLGTLEQHQLMFASLNYAVDSFSMSFQPFYRMIQNPHLQSIVYDTSQGLPRFSSLQPMSEPDMSSFGVHVRNRWNSGPFLIDASVQYTQNSDIYRPAPRIQARIQAEYSLIFGASTVTFGCTARMIEHSTTMRFIPYISTFAHDSMQSMNDVSWNGLDVHVSAILGNARIRASVMNLLSAKLMDVSGYPIQDNIIRLSLNWSFFD
jgi:hypothetical protein